MSSNSTTLGWVPESTGRGTWSIIWPCLSTLFLAVWVSWHPTIPGLDSEVTLVVKRLTTAGICVLVPDLMVYRAIGELFGIIDLRRSFQSIGIKCSLTQAAYVCMGGYAAIVPCERIKDDDDESALPDGLRMLTLAHILWLSERHILT